MASVVAVPPKPAGKQTSRKGKKAWRKNVDVNDVNEGLEQLRTEIISGGVVKEKTDELLFTLDTVGAPSPATQALSMAIRRAPKPLKADEILGQRSAIPALSNRKRASDTIITDGVVPAKKQHRATGVSYKELERLRRIAYGSDAAKDGVKTAEHTSATFDPWGDSPSTTTTAVGEDRYTFLEKPKAKVEPVTLKRKPVSLAVGAKAIPAVRLPNPGISYNPDFTNWDALITSAGDAEVADERKRLAEAEHEALIAAEALEEDALEASSESESELDDEEGEEGKEKAMYLRKRPERKTQAQRNKIKRRKEAEREMLRQAHMRKQKAQLAAVKSLAKVVAEKESKRLALLASGSTSVEADNATLRKRKFGKQAIPRAPLELQLPDELADSLRRLKPEGNLLRDRFRSLRERGILETRMPLNQQKKVKKIVTEKWSYKDWKF